MKKDYLIEFYNSLANKATANSYKSGMSALIKWYDSTIVKGVKGIKNFPSFFDALENIDNEDIANTFFSFIQVQLHKKITSSTSTSNPSKETLYNWVSYLTSFQAFWIKNELQNVTTKGIAKGVLKILKKNSEDVTYSHDELISEFVMRLTTQDRLSSAKSILFPIRLMNKIWKIDTQEWASKYAEEIYIIIKYQGRFEEVQINDIVSLNIKSWNEVSVIYKGEKCIVYTSYSDPYERLVVDSKQQTIQYYRKRTAINDMSATFSDRFEIDSKQNVIVNKEKIIWHVKPMTVAHLGEIAIDHDIPIALILEEKEKQLKQLEQITVIYKQISNMNGLTVSQKNANEFSSKYSTDFSREAQAQNVGFPKGDMTTLSKCKLVLMQGDENGRKSDN